MLVSRFNSFTSGLAARAIRITGGFYIGIMRILYGAIIGCKRIAGSFGQDRLFAGQRPVGRTADARRFRIPHRNRKTATAPVIRLIRSSGGNRSDAHREHTAGSDGVAEGDVARTIVRGRGCKVHFGAADTPVIINNNVFRTADFRWLCVVHGYGEIANCRQPGFIPCLKPV